MRYKKKTVNLSGKIEKFFGSYLSSKYPMKIVFADLEVYKLKSSYRDISEFQRERAGRVRENLKNNLFSFFYPLEVAIETFEISMSKFVGERGYYSLKEAINRFSVGNLSEYGARFTRDFMLKVVPFFSTRFIPFCDICYGRNNLSLFYSEKYCQLLISDSSIMGAITFERIENYEIEEFVDAISREYFYMSFESPFIDFVQIWLNENTFVLCEKCASKSGAKVRNFV